MPITLQEAKVGMADKVDQQIIDTFRRESFLLDSLTFDDSISPGTGGSTLTYGYIQLKTPSTVKTRKINEEYTAGEAKREEKTSKAVPFGGSFKIDRVIQGTSGAVDEMAFQMEQKIKAASNYFHNLVINGKKETGEEAGFVPDTFDGLAKLLAGKDTEITSTLDISDTSKLDTGYNQLLDEVDEFIRTLDGKPSMLLMNSKMLTKLKSAARRAGYFSRVETSFGKTVDAYDGIPLLDMGNYYDGSKSEPVIKVESDGTTSIYAVNVGLDGLHGISPAGNKIIQKFLPDMTQPGAVKTGEVEMIAGLVLKNTRKAGRLKGIKVTPNQ